MRRRRQKLVKQYTAINKLSSFYPQVEHQSQGNEGVEVPQYTLPEKTFMISYSEFTNADGAERVKNSVRRKDLMRRFGGSFYEIDLLKIESSIF